MSGAWIAAERSRSASALPHVLSYLALAMLVLCAAFSGYSGTAAEPHAAAASSHVEVAVAAPVAPATGCVGEGCANSSGAVTALCCLVFIAMWFWVFRLSPSRAIWPSARRIGRSAHLPAWSLSRRPSLRALCISRT